MQASDFFVAKQGAGAHTCFHHMFRSVAEKLPEAYIFCGQQRSRCRAVLQSQKLTHHLLLAGPVDSSAQAFAVLSLASRAGGAPLPVLSLEGRPLASPSPFLHACSLLPYSVYFSN